MLHETVKLVFTEESIKAGNHKVPETIANIEGMSNTHITCRMKDDEVIEFPNEDIQTIDVMDEDTHQEFTNEFLMQRKVNRMNQLTNQVLAAFDEIIDFCPETHATLLEDLELKLQRKIEED